VGIVTKQLVTVHNVTIVNGSPVLTPVTFEFDTALYEAPDDGVPLYPSDELQQESGRLNRSFNRGYFGS
jgi:hypothetical protein